MTRPFLACLLLLSLASFAAAQDKPVKPAEVKPTAEQEALFKKFTEQLSGAKLVGHFTMFGKEEGELKKEEYHIASVTKLAEGDYWLFKARVKYGDKDVTVPMPLEVKWAGDTPVITLTETTIPGMGTFSSRVVIYNDTYAGWWQHGKVGGHLFGRIEKGEAKEEKKEPDAK
jgi:hypothetical protein